MKIVKAGLCAGRHDIPVTDYIFGEIQDVTALERLNQQTACFLDAMTWAEETGNWSYTLLD